MRRWSKICCGSDGIRVKEPDHFRFYIGSDGSELLLVLYWYRCFPFAFHQIALSGGRKLVTSLMCLQAENRVRFSLWAMELLKFLPGKRLCHLKLSSPVSFWRLFNVVSAKSFFIPFFSGGTLATLCLPFPVADGHHHISQFFPSHKGTHSLRVEGVSILLAAHHVFSRCMPNFLVTGIF